MKTNKRMISFKLWAILALSLGIIGGVQAQYDAGYTHYMFNEAFINPAYSGSKDALSISNLNRLQWVGFKGAPTTFSLNAHTPLRNNNIGIGIGVLSDKIGVGSHVSGTVNFAYRLKVAKNQRLSFGLNLSAGGQQIDFSKLENIPSESVGEDVVLTSEHPSFIPNAGFGMYYYSDRYFVGLSIPRMLNNNYIEGVNKRFDFADWTYYLNGGYVFQFGKDFELMPAVMLKMTQGVSPQLDVSVTSLIKKTFWLGVDYRLDKTVAPIIGVQANRSFRITYSYDISLDPVKRSNLGGSHELSLSYTFDYIGKRVISPRLF